MSIIGKIKKLLNRSSSDSYNNQIEDNVAVRVEHVSMEFKISKDKIDTLKEYVIRTIKRNKKEKEKIRTDVTPERQASINRILYSLDADRVFIFECHNGVTNPSGLPFEFANMNYEVSNRERGVDRVYYKYKDVPLTMYTFPNYMRNNKFFIGTINELSKLDYEFAKHMKEDGGRFTAFIYLSHGDGPLGFLGISFHDMSRVPRHNLIENKIKAYGISIATLLDLKKQQEKK